MATNSTVREQQSNFPNRIVQGDCIEIMQHMAAESVDFILTDPPYLVSYRDRTGRTLQNDRDDNWLKPAMAEAYRVLKRDHLMVCFYGWTKIDRFFAAWHSAGFRPVGHMVFCKSYSAKARFMKYQHEQAYLMAKGNPPLPEHCISDVRELKYTGNALHPTQKAVTSLTPLIRAFTLPGDVVLDAFCGSASASTCAAALLTGREYIGIELDDAYYAAASARLDRIHQRIAAKRSAGALAA